MTERVVAVSGYFNPIHKGHIDLFREAKKLGDKLIVILNNDNQEKMDGKIHGSTGRAGEESYY